MTSLRELQSDYLLILDFYYQVINSMRGTPALDERLLGCEHLALKIFYHASTIAYLSSGTNLYIPTFPDGAHLVDFPSINVISRAIIETYLTLFEVYFESLTDDEFEYRHAVYQVRGFKLREDPRFIPLDADNSLIQNVQKGIQELDSARDRIAQTAHYVSLDPNQQKSTLQGAMFPKRTLKERVQLAGLGDGDSIEAFYAALSAHVHADALSATQIVGARTDIDKTFYIGKPMRLTMMIMALVIVHYCKKFSQAHTACGSNPAVFQLIDTIAKTASQMK